jgi:hypothetical protein
MGCSIKNEKGLYGSCHRIELCLVSSMEKALKAVQESSALTEAERLVGIECARLILSIPGRHQVGHGPRAAAHVILTAWPNRWVNGQQKLGLSEPEVKKEWELAARVRELIAKALPVFDKAGWVLAELEAALPKASAIKRMSGWTVQEATPEAAARAAEAWAIWMGGPRELGYMDGKKRPAGAASARLFESVGAARRTAKAAQFGGERGPAAIVKLMIEPLEVMEGAKGMAAVRRELARAESETLERSMEEASLDRLREALGEAPAREIQTIEEGSLAGSDEGYARWSGGWQNTEGGFVNYSGELGPLGGALLHASEGAAKNAGYWNKSTAEDGVAKVRARPVEICESFGEPNVKELKKAIEMEHGREQAEALARAGEAALKARAEALRTGAAQPVPRRPRSL